MQTYSKRIEIIVEAARAPADRAAATPEVHGYSVLPVVASSARWAHGRRRDR